MKKLKELKKIAYELDAAIATKLHHLVGVCVERDKKNPNKFNIIVDIDEESVKDLVPKSFKGQKIGVRIVDTPRFAQVL